MAVSLPVCAGTFSNLLPVDATHEEAQAGQTGNVLAADDDVAYLCPADDVAAFDPACETSGCLAGRSNP
tara:strand:- start:42 stop:248 length:207 start_codon:yes stop_codon:yes gene_type:complete